MGLRWWFGAAALVLSVGAGATSDGAPVPLLISPNRRVEAVSAVNPELLRQACASAVRDQADPLQTIEVMNVSSPSRVDDAHTACVVDAKVMQVSPMVSAKRKVWAAQYQVVLEIPTWRTIVTRVDLDGAQQVALAGVADMLFSAKVIGTSPGEATFEVVTEGGQRCTVTVSLPQAAVKPLPYRLKSMNCKRRSSSEKAKGSM